MDIRYDKSVFKSNNKVFNDCLKKLYKMCLIELANKDVKTLFEKDFSAEKSFGNILTYIRHKYQ